MGSSLSQSFNNEAQPSTTTTTTTTAPTPANTTTTTTYTTSQHTVQVSVSDNQPTVTTSPDLVNQFSLSNTTSPAAPLNHSTTSIQSDDSNLFKVHLFGTDIYPQKWFTLTFLYSILQPLSSLAMIVGCILPYVPQYVTINKTKNSKGFSTFVCLALLVANISRIVFWFGHRFELPLLIQSLIMIVLQILLLEICLRLKPQTSKRRSLFTSNIKYFWRWTDLLSYLEFICLMTLLLAISMYYLSDSVIFVETIGFIALITESMLGLPQFIKNYRNRSVVGMSLSMVFMWLGGDLYKTCYFLINKSPQQFVVCGLTQISIDLMILIQVCMYREKNSKKSGQFSLTSRK